jgi:hypothetical protein
MFLCLFIGLMVKAILTHGTEKAMDRFMETDMSKWMEFIQSEKFLRDAIGRGLFIGLFQVLGFSLFAVVLDKEVLPIGPMQN